MDALSDQVATGGALQVYEVFRQEREGGPMQHAGNLLAPDPELASHYAREFYGRRQESVRLWIVPRAAIRRLDDPDLLQPPLDRSFKKPTGYSADIKRKLAAARARTGVDSGEVEDEGPVVAAGRTGARESQEPGPAPSGGDQRGRAFAPRSDKGVEQ